MHMSEALADIRRTAATARPRLGFLGVGWIGYHRMRAIAEADVADIAAVSDPSTAMIAQATQFAPGAKAVSTFDELLDQEIDGVVIAVFCQKPLGRTGEEVREVVAAARSANRLLAVDLSYRFTEAMQRISSLVRSGELGHLFAVELTFHNAYGPDKPWFYDPKLSGGGCVIDLGVHLVDLALWVLDFPAVVRTSSSLFAQGKPLVSHADQAEDYAIATLDLDSGATVHLGCSWRLPAGQDAVISAAFYGTQGGAVLRNVNGSFYDFVAERCRGTARETLTTPPDAWFGRAAADWAERLAVGNRFDGSAERLVEVADVLDRIYGR
jgi:predicted dehydrogenase